MEYDIFLSHNSQDKESVRSAADAMREHGLDVWLDEEQLIPGTRWIPELEKAIQNSAAVAVMIGSNGLGSWERPEMEGALIQSVDRHTPVIPMLLPCAAATPELPLFLRTFTWVDCRNGFGTDVMAQICKSVDLGKQIASGTIKTAKEPTPSPSFAAKVKKSFQELKLKRIFWASKRFWLFGAAFLIPVILACLGYGPPWNSALGWTGKLGLVVVSITAQSVAFACVFALVDKFSNLKRWLTVSAICLGIIFTSYFIAFVLMTELQPDTGQRLFRGLIYQEKFLEHVHEFRLDNFKESKIDYGYIAEDIYKPWTVSTSKITLSFLWLGFVSFLGVLLAAICQGTAISKSESSFSDDSLVALGLPAPIRRTLYNCSIETIGDLCALNLRQLKEYSKMGERQIQTVVAALAKVGICLKKRS